MQTKAKYPTGEHERASEAIVDFLSNYSDIEAIILTRSCARGEATRDSCLDRKLAKNYRKNWPRLWELRARIRLKLAFCVQLEAENLHLRHRFGAEDEITSLV